MANSRAASSSGQTLQDFTPQADVAFPEVELTDDMEAPFALLPPHIQQFVQMTMNLAKCSRALAVSHQRLLLETEVIRADRDSLAAQLRGEGIPISN